MSNTLATTNRPNFLNSTGLVDGIVLIGRHGVSRAIVASTQAKLHTQQAALAGFMWMTLRDRERHTTTVVVLHITMQRSHQHTGERFGRVRCAVLNTISFELPRNSRHGLRELRRNHLGFAFRDLLQSRSTCTTLAFFTSGIHRHTPGIRTKNKQKAIKTIQDIPDHLIGVVP